MKLVELLAKVVSKWPVGAKYAVQDGDRRQTIKFGKTKGNLGIKAEGHSNDVWQNRSWGFTSSHDFDHDELASDFLTSIVTEAQWQAERDRQKGGEWKRHRGNGQPVNGDVFVQVKLRCGDIQSGYANLFLWNHADCDESVNIMKYKVISQPQAEEVEVKDTNIGTISYKVEIDTTAATHAIDELAAKWCQSSGPLAWRDAIIHCQAIIEDCEREIQRNVDLLDAEGLYMQLNAKVGMAYGEPDVDMGDWRNWAKGDIVEVILPNDSGLSVGKQYTIQKVEDPEYIFGMPVNVIDEDGNDYWPEDDEGEGRLVFKFIRRP